MTSDYQEGRERGACCLKQGRSSLLGFCLINKKECSQATSYITAPSPMKFLALSLLLYTFCFIQHTFSVEKPLYIFSLEQSDFVASNTDLQLSHKGLELRLVLHLDQGCTFCPANLG